MPLHSYIYHHLQHSFLFLRCIRFKHSSSALFVTGDKANQRVSVLTPYVDLTSRFQDITRLERNIFLRGFNVNVAQLREQWQILQNLLSDKLSLEVKRNEIADKMKDLKSAGNANDVEKYRTRGKVLRNELKSLMKTLWSLEEIVILKALALPNDLNPDTPDNLEKVVYDYGEVGLVGTTNINHIENGKNASLLEYFNPQQYYLKGTAAIYQLFLFNFFVGKLQSSNFILFSNADFARSVVLEGVGMDYHNSELVFSLKEVMDTLDHHNQSHLVGGASLYSFCAYHAKHVIQSEFVPLRYVSVGNQYKPSLDCSDGGLLNVSQSAVVEIFIGVEDCFDTMMREFHNVLDILRDLYIQLGYHFRIVYLPPVQLKAWESLRASIQLFSPYLQSYVEVGNLSTCDTYISKRLLMYYETVESCEHKFVRIISGTALSIPRLLSCVLESKPFISEKKLVIPDSIIKEMSRISRDIM